MTALTTRQQEILDFIRERLVDRGAPPTRADIMARFGFRSPTAADDHLRALARKGVIELIPGASRGIRLCTAAPPAPDGLPLIERLTPGLPATDEATLHQLPVDPGLFSARAHYLLRMRGDSMREAGIHDGDLLAIHRTATADSGQIVVARLDTEVLVRRLRRREGHADLLAAHPAYAPLRLDLARQPLQIEGRVVGLVRPGDMARTI